MRVARIGLAVLKGTRHQARSSVELAGSGPVGDRLFCLVDPERSQVLKTVAHGSLLAATATWDDEVLAVEVGGRLLADVPAPTGTVLTVDYWGRPVRAAAVGGPWAEVFSSVLGRPVVLARAAPGAIVYGGQVSVITTASLAGLRADRDAARFRSTFVIDTEDGPYAEAGAERAWIGRELQLGPARVRLTSSIVRCGVVDLDPDTGQRDLSLLRALPHDDDNRPVFGLQGNVIQPGLVTLGDRVDTIAP